MVEIDKFHPLYGRNISEEYLSTLKPIVTQIEPGFACGEHNSDGEGIVHLRPYNINSDGELVFSSDKFAPQDFNPKRTRVNDVFFNNTNSPELVGKTSLISNEFANLAFSNHMYRIGISEKADPEFIATQLHFLFLHGYFRHKCTSHVNQASISKRELLENTPIFLPNIQTQRVIVERIKRLLKPLGRGLCELEVAKKQLDLYRQSVLKDAFEGKLTADWRAANPDKVEPADKLLARIEAERKAAHQAELDSWAEAVKHWEAGGREGKKPSKPKLVKSYQDSDIKYNPQGQLPPSWTACLLGSLMVKPPKNGVYKPQSDYKDDGIPIVRIDNLKPSKIDSLEKLKKVELQPNELLQYKLTDGDLVLNRVNSIEHIGKSAFINHLHSDLVFESNLMKFHPSEKFISRKYLSAYLNSPAGLKELRKNAKHAVNQASINQDDVANAIVILPGYTEQIELERIFEGLELLIAHSKEQIKENIHRAKILKQSILTQALSGDDLLENAS